MLIQFNLNEICTQIPWCDFVVLIEGHKRQTVEISLSKFLRVIFLPIRVWSNEKTST